jgi:hypothetical protein
MRTEFPRVLFQDTTIISGHSRIRHHPGWHHDPIGDWTHISQ